MAGDVAVLLGPTLTVAEARRHLDAIYLPPAEQGSVFRAVAEHRPAVLAIIDGAFAQRPAVRHKEILWAMARGLPGADETEPAPWRIPWRRATPTQLTRQDRRQPQPAPAGTRRAR